MNEIGFNRFRIQLIENYPCSDKYEMRQKKREYIRKFGSLNMYVAGTWTIENNQEYQKEYSKQRYETQPKIPIICECGCSVGAMSKKRHENTQKNLLN